MLSFFSVFSMFFFFCLQLNCFFFSYFILLSAFIQVFFHPPLPKKLYIFFFFFNLLFLTTFTKSHKYLLFFRSLISCLIYIFCIFTNHFFVRENRHTLLCFLSYANCFVSLHKKNFKVLFFTSFLY